MNADMKVKEIVERLDRNEIVIRLGKGVDIEQQIKKCVMLITHEFSRSGAPTMLLEMANTMRKQGTSVWILCNAIGPLMESFLESGHNVIVYNKYLSDSKWMRMARRTFDLWCVNTMVLFDVFQYLNRVGANVVWWVHEGEGWFEVYKDLLPNLKIGKRTKILAAGPYVQRMFEQYASMKVSILNFVITDVGMCMKVRQPGQKVRFLQAGMIDGNKRQGLFAEAIALLPNEIREASEFIICANREGADISELSKVDRIIEKYNNVKLVPQVERKILYEMYDYTDAVVVASLIETTSAVMVESMMKGKVGICSSTCGVASYLEDGKNGFIFQSGNAKELAKKITYVVENINEMSSVGTEARKVYENVYSREIFEKEIEKIEEWFEDNRSDWYSHVLTSIIVVTSNSKQQLLMTLRSIYNQTYHNYEVVVIDDASTDDSVEAVAEEFGAKENLKYYINEEKQGKGKSYNLALECCEGDYIAFVEAGDIWLNDKLESQLEVLIANDEYEGIYSYARTMANEGQQYLCPSSGNMLSNIQQVMIKDIKKVRLGTIVLHKSTLQKIGCFCEMLDEHAGYEFLLREMGKLKMYGLSEITMFTAEYTNLTDNIEEFIYANCLVLINQFEDIQSSGYREEFFPIF